MRLQAGLCARIGQSKARILHQLNGLGTHPRVIRVPLLARGRGSVASGQRLGRRPGDSAPRNLHCANQRITNIRPRHPRTHTHTKRGENIERAPSRVSLDQGPSTVSHTHRYTLHTTTDSKVVGVLDLYFYTYVSCNCYLVSPQGLFSVRLSSYRIQRSVTVAFEWSSSATRTNCAYPYTWHAWAVGHVRHALLFDHGFDLHCHCHCQDTWLLGCPWSIYLSIHLSL